MGIAGLGTVDGATKASRGRGVGCRVWREGAEPRKEPGGAAGGDGGRAGAYCFCSYGGGGGCCSKGERSARGGRIEGCGLGFWGATYSEWRH